jgi:hypothetical protein
MNAESPVPITERCSQKVFRRFALILRNQEKLGETGLFAKLGPGERVVVTEVPEN